MKDFKTMISYAEAMRILENVEVTPLPSQKVAFNQAVGRILAQNIRADKSVPPFPTSAMDGFAINFNDLQTLRDEGLELQAINRAGLEESLTLSPKCTIATYTGSKMPLQSDTMVLIEDIIKFKKNGKEFIRLLDSKQDIKFSQWVRQVGDNYKSGDILLHQGSRISPFEVGILADLNKTFVQVSMRPKVGILSIGDEIIEVGEQSERTNALRNVNNHLIGALCESLGCESILFENAGDDKKSITALYKQALQQCDVFITTGGMSVGDFDFTQEVMQEFCEMQFKGVRLKPGKPVAYGIYTQGSKKTHIFGLPGNPNSCAATFYLFARVILARLNGTKARNFIIKGRLLESIQRADYRMEFRACEVELKNGEFFVSFKSKKSLQSSMINNLGLHTAFAILPENGGSLKKGQSVEVLLFRDIL